ncbi:histidine kinase [Halalkalibacillus sediminis]|uniref:histidine kinase n=1 Tax=Halalkalibacillus sediminis TaxID=2018042 RepID=A0A2I0QTV1_9BACI|nr:sensor histidine kinase [Halalkalibacillus sediminis]PKR77739.1 histidine kinase [Halalkalibacillus sediminis]
MEKSLKTNTQREQLAKQYMLFITIAGWVILVFHLFNLDEPQASIYILLLFALFIGITEYYPIPVWNGFTTVNFPIVYVLYLAYDIHYAITIYALIVPIIYFLQRRPIRSIFFNPAQLVISFYLAYLVTTHLVLPSIQLTDHPIVIGSLIYTCFLIIFYSINNLLVDIVLVIRPQPYPLETWKKKIMTELNSALFSFIYGVLLYVISTEDRGQIDMFSYFFFFAPLIALSFIGSSFVRIKAERNRLKRLFHLTRDLNTYILKEDGLSEFIIRFKQYMFYDQAVLILKENDEWIMVHRDEAHTNNSNKSISLNPELFLDPLIYKNRKDQNGGPLSYLFSDEMQTFIYNPIKMEDELLGLIVVAKMRNNSFVENEQNILATVSNQLAAVLITRRLIQEKEEHSLLEERNRIARNIHDGIAQNLAAAVLQLETALKKHDNQKASRQLINQCITNLRESLFEVRNSIYTLRPPTEHQTGLIPAIHKRIEEFTNQDNNTINFRIKGKPYALSTMLERVIFDTFQESVQNSLKHSGADHIHVLLDYKDDHTLLKVKDDGRGFSLFHAMIKAEREGHFGIMQLNERAEKINGSLQINSKEGKGTEIILSVPRIETEGSK